MLRLAFEELHVRRFGRARDGIVAALLVVGAASTLPAMAESVFGSGGLRGTQFGTTFEVPETSSVATLSCSGRAGIYGREKGLRVWVLRQGSMQERNNPLRPLSRERIMVLEVVANGRLATAFGPDAANLTGGGAAPELERLNSPIRWSPPGDQFPDTIRVISADGSPVIGPLPFRECGEAPRAAPARVARPAASASNGGGGTYTPPVTLPQGAIPERP